jgi:DNA-binding CsgD family transcriptional regulator
MDNRRSRLIGRDAALRSLEQTLDEALTRSFRFLTLVGEPGVGKTRLLDELAGTAARRSVTVLRGRAAEFEQELPFGVVIGALDDHLETCANNVRENLGAGSTRFLGSVFPGLLEGNGGAPDAHADVDADADLRSFARYRLYRTIRLLLEELAVPSGLLLVLDDVHWADHTSLELFDYLLRHPPRGPVLIAFAYRPAQAAPRLAALVQAAPRHGREISVKPLNQAEAEEFLGPEVGPAHARELYEISGGNPFYLEALTRMGHDDLADHGGPATGIALDLGDLPPAVRASLLMELTGLPEDALLVAQAAAVTADEFEPALAAVAADVPGHVALEALNEAVARDVVRPAAPGRFRFRHPLVRHAAYGSAPAGWRFAAHARIAGHLAALGASASMRAHHVERSGSFGDQAAVDTLVAAAREVSARAPAAAAHWLQAALRLLPADHDIRPELLLELATAQGVSGRLLEGRDAADEALRLLPPDDHMRRARSARILAIMERHLGRPNQGRAVLFDELDRISDPRSPAAVTLRLRLVADSLLRSDFRTAGEMLDLVPDNAAGWPPSLPLAVASLRPLPALTAGRVDDAVRHVETAGRLVSAAPDEHLTDWLEAIAWLAWTEMFMMRLPNAGNHFDRAIHVARFTGQTYILPIALAGQTRTYALQGRLAEAAILAEEASEVSRLVASKMHLAVSLVQQCLVATWSGDDAELELARRAVERSTDAPGWYLDMARALALISAGHIDEGAEVMVRACGDFRRPKLDLGSLLICCELMADIEAGRGRQADSIRWAEQTSMLAHSGLPASVGFAGLATAHAERSTRPHDAAVRAGEAADVFLAGELRIHAGRARLVAGSAYAQAGERDMARAELYAAAEILASCGASGLHAQAQRELRRIGVRVAGAGGRGRGAGSAGLSKRELEVATLVGAGHTNQQIAEKLFLSVRTVETHLSHIFAKLDVTSRVGVVSALNQRDGAGEKSA